METRKRLWIAALCLLSATVVTIGLRHYVMGVQAAPLPANATLPASSGPTAHLTNPALRTATVPDGIVDDDGFPLRVIGTAKSETPMLPRVEEFTLTPPNGAQGATKTTLALRFPATQAATLASSIPFTLGRQNVVLQRSQQNPNTFVTSVDFDWQAFEQEQGLRKQASLNGKMVPVFNGRRFLRSEPMQFVEPSQIEQALETHQPIQFDSGVLESSSTVNVFPDHELMMNSPAVVIPGPALSNSPARTFDQCLPAGQQGNPNGAWTFNTLMLAIAGATPSNPVPAENMLLNMLDQWNHDQTINTFEVFERTRMGSLGSNGSGFLSNWPIDTAAGNTCTLNGQPSACPSLAMSPMRLEAIVNRLDLGQFSPPNPPAGELRFVFTASATATAHSGACANQGGLDVINIILEYNVPANISALAWAQQWNNLPDLNSNGNFSVAYLNGLQAITDQVVTPGACPSSLGGTNGSCIAQIRTNEIGLAPTSPPNVGLWELRELHFSTSGGVPTFTTATVAQTPDNSFNTAGIIKCSAVNNGICTPNVLSNYINNNATTILNSDGSLPVVPLQWDGVPFRGGSALNNSNVFWADVDIINSEPARVAFSLNTCAGCHGGETQTAFQQVFNRHPTVPSNLSSFLLGCTSGNATCGVGSAQQCALSTENLGQNTNGPCVEDIQDPNNSSLTTAFGDIARRVSYLQMVCGNSTCTPPENGSQLLLPFMRQPIGVH